MTDVSTILFQKQNTNSLYSSRTSAALIVVLFLKTVLKNCNNRTQIAVCEACSQLHTVQVMVTECYTIHTIQAGMVVI